VPPKKKKKDMKTRRSYGGIEPHTFAGKKVKWHSQCIKQFGSSSNNYRELPFGSQVWWYMPIGLPITWKVETGGSFESHRLRPA
jgi:hypothetical protein